MLTQEGCLARRRRMWKAVAEDLEWVLIADPRHVHYLANFWVNPLSFSGGERGLLLLEREGGASLIADNFAFRSSAVTPYVDRDIIEDWYDHRHSVINRDHALLRGVESVSERLYGRKGAIEAEWLPYGAWELLGLDRESHSVEQEAGGGKQLATDLGTCLRELRRQKEPDEIALLKECMIATDAGHARAGKSSNPASASWRSTAKCSRPRSKPRAGPV